MGALDRGVVLGHRGAEGETAEEDDMGWYREQVVPRIVDVACDAGPAVREVRARVCAGLAGEVVEIGMGSGLNAPHYPASVTRVAGVEPSDVAWRLARPRIAATPVTVERAALDGQSLPFPDDSFDCALSTWTMCTIPDLGAALAELRRVLRPGGTLHFVEHGLAPDERVARWQRRLDPLQQRLFGGCHLDRRILEAVEDAGFTPGRVEVFYQEGTPRVFGAETLGVAAA